MDYEKKYNEAMLRADEAVQKGCLDKGMFDIIFPPDESEDERMVRVIGLALTDVPEERFTSLGTTLNGCLSYLKKQKEQKPVERSLEDDHIIGFVYDLLNEIEWKDNWAMSKEECLRLLNNYSPQKPAEWSEKHIADIFEKVGLAKIARKQGNYALTNAIQDAMLELSKVENAEWSEDYQEENIQTRFAFYTYKDDPSTLYLSNVFVEEASRNHGFGTRILRAAEKVAETIGATTISLKVKQDSPANAWYRKNGYGYVAFEDGYDWLEKNLEYLKPVKQEWSDEDERMRNQLIYDVEYHKKEGLISAKQNKATKALYNGIEKCYDEKIAWLKSLPLSLKKKNDLDADPTNDRANAIINAFDSLPTVSREQPEVDLAEEITRFFSKNPIPHEHITDWPLLKNTAIHFYGLRNRALEEASRHVYESWMGGTMNDVRRDMVELGKVLNARKENK